MKYGLLMGLLVACTKPNPNYHPDGAVTIDAEQTSDGTMPSGDAKPACKHELLVQQGGLFDSPQLVVVDADTFETKPISNGVDHDFDGTWSPDGTHLAFTRNEHSIWITDADGSNGHELVSDADKFLSHVAWTHDGSRLAYASSSPSGGDGAVYSIGSTASTGVNLTSGVEADPPIAWSPDDKQLLFVGFSGGDTDVYVVAASGGYQDLTKRAGADGRTSVQWIDNGAAIVFDASHIWTMNADGSSPKNLTGTSRTETQPTWSPATSKIYYVVDGSDIYVMNHDGTGQHQVSNATSNTDPAPSPDGLRLAFTSARDASGSTDVYVSGANGEMPTRATNNGKVFMPRWRPCP